MSDEPLLARLAELVTDAPEGLIDRIAARWVTVGGPVGEMFVAYTDHGIAYVRPAGDDARREFRRRFGRPLLPAPRPPAGLVPALRTGDAGGLRFDLRELTPFQAEVLRAARSIPRGEVRPYSWIARRVNRPGAVRAVGTALATNPVPLLIPCHRVVRSDGHLGNYSLGRPENKLILLNHEGADPGWLEDLARRGVRYRANVTTGIYCHPTCRSIRRSKPENVIDLREPIEGFRPCEVCRPA